MPPYMLLSFAWQIVFATLVTSYINIMSFCRYIYIYIHVILVSEILMCKYN